MTPITSSIETVFTLENISAALVRTNIDRVLELNQTIKVDVSCWEACLEYIQERCAVSWVCFRKNQPTNNEPNTTTSKKIVFSKVYKCHRSGSYKSIARVDGRPNQKKTKKCGCLAQLKVVCQFKTPSFCYFVPVNQHSGHVPGENTDIPTLPLPPAIIAEIDYQLLHTNKTIRQIQIDVQKMMDEKSDGSNNPHSQRLQKPGLSLPAPAATSPFAKDESKSNHNSADEASEAKLLFARACNTMKSIVHLSEKLPETAKYTDPEKAKMLYQMCENLANAVQAYVDDCSNSKSVRK